MAKRWLKIEVTKTLITDVYVCVDDAVTPVTVFEMYGHKRIGLTHELRKIGEDAARDVDWTFADEDVSAGETQEVTEEEAKQYRYHDMTRQ